MSQTSLMNDIIKPTYYTYDIYEQKGGYILKLLFGFVFIVIIILIILHFTGKFKIIDVLLKKNNIDSNDNNLDGDQKPNKFILLLDLINKCPYEKIKDKLIESATKKIIKFYENKYKIEPIRINRVDNNTFDYLYYLIKDNTDFYYNVEYRRFIYKTDNECNITITDMKDNKSATSFINIPKILLIDDDNKNDILDLTKKYIETKTNLGKTHIIKPLDINKVANDKFDMSFSLIKHNTDYIDYNDKRRFSFKYDDDIIITKMDKENSGISIKKLINICKFNDDNIKISTKNYINNDSILKDSINIEPYKINRTKIDEFDLSYHFTSKKNDINIGSDKRKIKFKFNDKCDINIDNLGETNTGSTLDNPLPICNKKLCSNKTTSLQSTRTYYNTKDLDECKLCPEIKWIPPPCNYNDDEIKLLAKNFYETQINQKIIKPYDIKKVNDTQFDLSFNWISSNQQDIGIDKRRFTFEYDKTNCKVIIKSMDNDNSGITAKDPTNECNTFKCNNKKQSLQSTRTSYNTSKLIECNYCSNEKWDPLPCQFNQDIAKSKAKDYYNTQSELKGQYTIQPYFINKVNDTTFDMSYVYTKNDNTDIGTDKRRFSFNYNNSNCDINITSMGLYLSGITSKDAPVQCNTYICNNKKQSLQSNRTSYNTTNLTECKNCPNESWNPPQCQFNQEVAKSKAKDYYNTQGPYKGQYTIQPYYINKINDSQFDMSYVYTKNDNTDIGTDRRRFNYNYNNSNCDINIVSMGDYLSGNTVQEAPVQCNSFLCNNRKQQIKNNNQRLRSNELSECNNCPVENWDPPTCNYSACDNVKNIYRNNNWPYDTANFGECSYCSRDTWSGNVCNYSACDNVKNIYKSRNWAYDTVNLGECNYCPRDTWSGYVAPPPPQNSCNYGACRNVIQSYLNNGWWYNTSNFGECVSCPQVTYPNSI